MVRWSSHVWGVIHFKLSRNSIGNLRTYPTFWQVHPTSSSPSFSYFPVDSLGTHWSKVLGVLFLRPLRMPGDHSANFHTSWSRSCTQPFWSGLEWRKWHRWAEKLCKHEFPMPFLPYDVVTNPQRRNQGLKKLLSLPPSKLEAQGYIPFLPSWNFTCAIPGILNFSSKYTEQTWGVTKCIITNLKLLAQVIPTPGIPYRS